MKKPIGPDFFKDYINLSRMESNGADDFVFVKCETDLDEDKYVSELYLHNLKDMTTRQLTHAGKAPKYAWLDKDNLIVANYFPERGEGKPDADKADLDREIPLTVFGKLNVRTGEYNKLFKIYHDISDFRIIDENRFLVLAVDSPVRDKWIEEAGSLNASFKNSEDSADDESRTTAYLSTVNWDKYLKIKEREERFIVVDEYPYYSDGSGYINKERGRLYFCDHGELTLLTEDDITVCAIDSYKDKYGVFYAMEAGGYQRSQGMLFIVEYEDLNVKCIDSTMKYIYTKVRTIDETRLLVMRNDYVLHGEYQDEYIDIIDLKTQKFTRNNVNTDWHLYDMVLSDMTYDAAHLSKYFFKKDGFYLIITVSGSSDIYYTEYGRDETLRRITRHDGKIIDYFLQSPDTADEKIIMAAMRGMGGTELYELDPATGEEKIFSAYNTRLPEIYEYPETEELNFTDSDGVYIEGWVMKPVGFRPDKKYPAILFIHGGPECAWGPTLMNERLIMAAMGYGVIFCNPRGSEGRGAEFCDIRGKWMDVDYRDLMEFTDYALETCGWIDGDRLGVTGGSYGGIMTNLIIGHTDRFRAAISDRGVSEEISDSFLCDLGLACSYDTYQCTPWDDVETLWEQSAVKYAPAIKTPVLFIHGVEDYRCPFDNALLLHTAITYHGGTSKVIGFKGESHGLSRIGKPYNRLRRLEEMATWFKKYLEEYEE